MLTQLTLDCGKVRRAKWPIPSSLLQQQSCQNHRICVAGCFNCTKGNPSLVAVTLHSHITGSPVTCHPVQCRANMRVTDCTTVWVCKCLQLIYLSALHLYNPCWHLHCTINWFNQTSLSWRYDDLPGAWILWTLWFAREHDKWWDLDPFEDKQAGLVQSMGAKGKNCWEAVEIGNGKA